MKAALLFLLFALPAVGGERPAVPLEWIKRNVEQQIVGLEGWLEPFEQVDLYARVEGYLERLEVDLGSWVEAGEVIAKLQVPDLELEAREAEAELKRVEAELQKAEAILKIKERIASRLLRLHKSSPGAVAQEEVDRAVEAWRVAEAEVEVKRAALEEKRVQLANLKTCLGFALLKAPFSGVVTRRWLHEGAFVPAGKEPIVTLARIDRLRLVVLVPERLAPFLRPGQEVRVRFPALPGQTFKSHLARLGEVVGKRGMRVEADLPLRPGLLPGMKGIVSIKMW